MAEEFAPIETQEALDALLQEREDTVRDEYKDYEELKKTAETQAATIKKYQSVEMRRKVAKEVGLPDSLAGRISGEDEKSMLEDAKELLASLPTQKRHAPPMRNPDAKPTKEDKVRKLLGDLKLDY